MLLRKGGIHEPQGDFKPAHEEFFLLPAREHQRLDLLKPEAGALPANLMGAEASTLMEPFRLKAWARLHAAVALSDPCQAYELAGEHIWTEAYVRQRVEYKPERPLFVLLLRVYRLEQELVVPWNERYVGCRSWVELDAPLEAELKGPVLDDAAFGAMLSRFGRLGIDVVPS